MRSPPGAWISASTSSITSRSPIGITSATSSARWWGSTATRREVEIAPFVDEDGVEVTPGRRVPYDVLVMAVGGITNDFGTPGVARHAVMLDATTEAARFHRRLVNACMRAHSRTEALRPEQLQVAIIGAGATGVELAAELHKTTRELVAYGLDRIDPEKDIRLTVIEAADRILPALPARIAEETQKLLANLRIDVLTSSRVAEVTATGVRLADGRVIPAELVVWAAGVKAPDFLKDLAGLETDRLNRLVVRPTLADDPGRQCLRARRLRLLSVARHRDDRAAAGPGGASAGDAPLSRPAPISRGPRARGPTATATSAPWCRSAATARWAISWAT